jgi:hypothetical protein
MKGSLRVEVVLLLTLVQMVSCNLANTSFYIE